MSDPPLWSTAAAATLLLLLATCLPASAAPMHDAQQVQHQLDEYYGGSTATGCYYNFIHYEEGDRIMTNEPCLNCTCHNRMLMCYLRVCPFSKGIGQDCTVEQKPDQCCPVITCPEVPVQLITSSTTITTPPAPTGSTAVGHPDNYGCTIDEVFYSDGTKIPGDPTKPCELCYCIRNHTACVMQECTLHVEGCRPVYVEGVCCPVRYDCDYQEYTTSAPLLETTLRPTPGLLFTTTMAGPLDCRYGEETYADGALIETEEPCQHCYCMRGDIVCAVQECGTPLEREAGNCTALPPQPGQCCPQQYQCDNVTVPFDILSQGMETAQPSKSTDSTKSDEQVSLSTEATVVQHSTVDKEEHVQQQGSLDEAQEHLNEVEQGLEQHTHYEDEEIEKGTEIEHITNPVEHEGQGTVEHFTQAVEHLPAEGSGHITLESDSSVTEAVIASSEKQRTTLEGAETATESLTELNVASISEGIQTIEQVPQQEFTSSPTENGNEDVHDEQSLTADADNHPSVAQTTLSGESASSSSIGELPEGQVTTEQNAPDIVTLKDEIGFTHKSTSTTQTVSDTDEESEPVTHEIIAAESDSTEKVEQQDLTPPSSQSSPANEFITSAAEIQSSTDKTEESASVENIPDSLEPSEGEEAISHVTDTQIHEDEHTVATPVRTSIVPETGGITIPVQDVEGEIVTEGLEPTDFESGDRVTVTESTQEHVTNGPVVEISPETDKIDEVSHEQSVTEANVAEEAGHTPNDVLSEVHEAEQQTSGKPPQLPMEEHATISEGLELSTGVESIHHTTSISDSADFVSELVTTTSPNKQEEGSFQATETVLNEDTDNDLDSATKADETEHVTVLHDIISSSSESDTGTGLNEVLTTVQPAVDVIGITQESSIDSQPGQEAGKPTEASVAAIGETADESETSAEVTDTMGTVTTKLETTGEDIKEQHVTAPTELKPSASTGKIDEELLITHPPETAEPSISNEVSFESSGDSTEESVHHLVSEMNGKPTEIHTTPSESALNSQSSHEETNAMSEESQQEGLGATEPVPPNEPVVVQQSTESGELFEQEGSQKPASEEDAEVVTGGSIPSEEHQTESTPQETNAAQETGTSSEANQKPGMLEEVATEQASVSESLHQEPVEQQVIHEPTETGIVEPSTGGISIISTPGFDEIENELSQQQTQKPIEADGNQYTTEVSAPGFSDTASEQQQPQKPAEDGGLPSAEGSAVTQETVTTAHDVPQYHETQESTDPEKQPNELPLTTSGVGGFVQELSTATSIQGPIGIPTSGPPHALIPGEGNCLVDGKTYANNSEIPPPSHCHVSCHCISSIVHCVSVNCPPPPTHLKNCTPVRHSDDACCPTYTCDVEHKVTLVADSMVAATGRPMVSSETSAAPSEEHQEDTKPQITDSSSSLDTDQDSNVVTEAHPVYHGTETEEQENAGDTVHDTTVTEKPETVSSAQEGHIPASPEPTETQTSHVPSSEKPADEHLVQQEEKDQQSTEVQQTVQPVEDGLVEEQAPSEVKPEATEAVIQEGADTLEHTVSPSESQNADQQVTTEKASTEDGYVPTISPVGISETKEDHTYTPTSSAEEATTVVVEHSSGSSDAIPSPGSSSTAPDAVGPQQPIAAVTEHTDSSPGLSPSVIDEHHVEHFTISTDHITQPPAVTASVEGSAHEDQSSQTSVSSTDQVSISSPHTEAADAESVTSGQVPSESIPDAELPSVETVTDKQQTVSIIHSDVPSVAPPESDSQSKDPTTASSEQMKPEEFLNTEKPDVSSSSQESYETETVTASSSNDDEHQGTTSVIHHLPSEKPSDHQQQAEHQTDFPAITGFEETVFPQQAGEVDSEEGSGHEEPIHPVVTEAAELEQQSSSHPETMEEHQQTVSQGSLLSEEETTVQSESETQQSPVFTEHVPPVQPVGEEQGGIEASSIHPETSKPDSVHQHLPEQDTILTGTSGDVHTTSPLESDSQQSSVPENQLFDSDLPTTQKNEQSSPSVEVVTEHLPQQPVILEGEAESNEQSVTLPTSDKEDSTVIQESLFTEQEKQTEKHPEEMQTVSPIDDIAQQELVSQQPVQQPSDTEETAEQQTHAPVAASQQPDTIMQEEVDDIAQQELVSQQPVQKPSDTEETAEQQTLAPVAASQQPDTVMQEEVDDIAQQELVSQQPVQQPSDTEETAEQQTLAPVAASQQPDTVMQEEVDDIDQQELVSQQPVQQPSDTEETAEQQTLAPVAASQQPDTVMQEEVDDIAQQELVSQQPVQQPSDTEETAEQQTLAPVAASQQPDTVMQEEVDDIDQQELVSQQPVQQPSDTEEIAEQQTFAPIAASQQPDTVMQEEVTDRIPDDKQPLSPTESDAQHVVASHPHESDEGSGAMETAEIQTLSPITVEEASSTVSQESALPGSEAVSAAETGQEEGLASEEEKESVATQQPIQAVSQQESVSDDKTPDSITENYVEQQTSLTGDVSSQHDIISQEPVVDEQHEQTTFAADSHSEHTPAPLQPVTGDKTPDILEHETTTSLASDTQTTVVSVEPISSEEEELDKLQTLLPPGEDSQHVSIPHQHAPTTEEMILQTSSPVFEDKESSASVVTVSDDDKTPGFTEETSKQTVAPLDHDVQHSMVPQEGAPVTEPAEQQTRFTAQDEMVHIENTQKPSLDGQQVTEVSGLSDVVTNLPVDAETEQFLIGEEGIEKVTEAVDVQTTSPTDSENKQTDVPSQPVTIEQVANAVSSSDEEHSIPSVIPDIEPTHISHPESQVGHETIVTDVLDEQSTASPEQPEISETPTVPVAGTADEIQVTNIPEEHVSHAAEANVDDAGEINVDMQTTTSLVSQSPVETVSTVQELGELHPSTPEETEVQQVTTAQIPETSSEKPAELEEPEIQHSSVSSETGIQEASTFGEQEASVIEDTGSQNTISPIESGAHTVNVDQPVSAPDVEQEPASPSEPEIQQAANTEQSVLAEGDSSSVAETSVETATSAVQQPTPSKEEQHSSAESLEQTARPTEGHVQEATATESISEQLATSDKDTSISFSKPADQESVPESTVTSDEPHLIETVVSTSIPEGLESQSSSSKAPDVDHGVHNTTSDFAQSSGVQESGTVTLAIIHPSQAPIESADHHIEISEQSSQGTVTEATTVQHEHTTSAPVKPPVHEEEEEQVANNVHPVEVTEGNQILPASSEHPLHTTAQPAPTSLDHSDTSQASASPFHPDQRPAHSSTSHPAYEHFPEDHTLAIGEGIEHITEATKRPSHHFTTRPPLTTGSHHHPSQHPEDQYEQFPFGEGQYPTGGDTDYDDEEQAAFGPGTCRYGGKVYVSAQQIPRDDPCDFCFCFRSDIICLQQSCPPPIPGCHEEPIQGFCCPRYECPVSMATVLNVSTTTTTTTTTLPPHFLAHHYKGAAHRTGCQVQGSAYRVGEVVHSASGPCLECRCGGDGQMKCDPKECSPEPMLRKMIMAAASRRR
ncbi:mucin-17 isoform X3 [Schistocerca gregaria]|uniref:mucin-17 isoform X3 n=1 Tax=Schistocerca gregaria TaxID=7010 RepID=UPI00211EA1E5|nr:mucin-17 isoform X3 [Schistocerca gregaria]